MYIDLPLDDIVEFILKNRSGKAFKDWTPTEILYNVALRFSRQEASYTRDPSTKKINGVVLACANPIFKTIRIVNILTLDSKVIKIFIRRLQEQFPDYSIEYKHHGKERYFTLAKTKKLCSLITK